MVVITIDSLKYVSKYLLLISNLICLTAIIVSNFFKSTSSLAYAAFYECIGTEIGLNIIYRTTHLICLIIERNQK